MENLSSFSSNIKEFDILSKGQQIDLFAYYLQKNRGQDGFISKDITKCFDFLNLPRYSDISQYLSKKSKLKSKTQYYFKKEGEFFLHPKLIKKVELFLSIPSEKTPSKNLIDPELFTNTRNYISRISIQAILCYDNECYDACSVMIRRLIETLIVECYEKKGLTSKIKESSGEFKSLERLIATITLDPVFNLSRNTKITLPKLKSIGDLSAHNRRYLARKSDIEGRKHELRVVMEELITIIDYPKWK